MYQHLTLNEMLLLIANMKGLDDKSAREGVEKALRLVNLTDCAEKEGQGALRRNGSPRGNSPDSARRPGYSHF